MRKISLSNFTHLNKIKWRIFIPVQKAWYVKKIARGGWSGFGKALTWDPSQMITCHPKKIPKFLLKGGVVQFCQIFGTIFSGILWALASFARLISSSMDIIINRIYEPPLSQTFIWIEAKKFDDRERKNKKIFWIKDIKSDLTIGEEFNQFFRQDFCKKNSRLL